MLGIIPGAGAAPAPPGWRWELFLQGWAGSAPGLGSALCWALPPGWGSDPGLGSAPGSGPTFHLLRF